MATTSFLGLTIANLDSGAGPDAFVLSRLSGTESVSGLFEYELEILSRDGNVSYAKAIGSHATVTIAAPPGSDPNQPTRYLNGFIAEFEQRAPEGGFAVYRAKLVPGLWFLRLNRASRVFVNQSIPDIVGELLGNWNSLFEYSLKLTGRHAPWEYMVQYQESDYAFICRLLEQEGIFYFFEHMQGEHKMVLCDDSISLLTPGNGSNEEDENVASPMLGNLAFMAENDVPKTSRVVRKPVFRMRTQSGAFRVSDYDYNNASTKLVANQKLSSGSNEVLAELTQISGWTDNTRIYEYPGNYTDNSTGEDYVRLKMERAMADVEFMDGYSDFIQLRSASGFNFTQFPRSDRNQEYFVLKTTTVANDFDYQSTDRASDEPAFSTKFTTIPASITYRPPRETPKPLVHGYHIAEVVGDSSSSSNGNGSSSSENAETYKNTIDCDLYGSVKVIFPWDQNEQKSIYIRVSQAWAGGNRGSQFIPHVGDEVLVAYLAGDPNRPIIVGRVHNNKRMPPMKAVEHKTQSVIRDDTDNVITLESDKGNPYVHVQTQCGHQMKFSGKSDDQYMHMRDSHGQQFLLDAKNKNMQFYVPGKVRQIFGDHSNVRDITKTDWDNPST